MVIKQSAVQSEALPLHASKPHGFRPGGLKPNPCRRQFIAAAIYSATLAAAGSALLATPPARAADAFPSKPITIVLPYATGGTSDMLARFAAQALTTELGQTAIVEAKPGAGGVLGTEFVARAAGDGYTLALTASGTMGVNPYVYKLRYDPLKDFKQITVLVDLPFVVVTNNEFPARDLKAFTDYAHAHPNGVTFGNAGLGTQQHLTQLMFAKAAGIQVNLVPYKGSTPAMNDLLGGHINAVLDNTGVQTPFIHSGKVHALFVTSAERLKVLPDVPTAREAGLKDFSAVAWFGLAAPKDTPDAVVDKIQQALARQFSKPEMQQRLLDLGMIPRITTPAETTARVREDLQVFGKIAKDVGLQPM